MVGILKGNLYLLGKEPNVIKAKNEKEEDSVWYKLTFGDGAGQIFQVTCGEKWKCEVKPGNEVPFDVRDLIFGRQYEVSFNVDTSSGYNKLKLRTFKDAVNAQQAVKTPAK